MVEPGAADVGQRPLNGHRGARVRHHRPTPLRLRVIAGYLLALAAVMAMVACASQAAPAPAPEPFDVRGFNVVGWNITSMTVLEESLREAIATGANTVLIDYTVAQPGGLTGTTIEGGFPSLDVLMESVGIARRLGLKAWVKPYVIIGSVSDPDAHKHQSIAPSDPAAWFASYGAEVLRLATRAEAAGAEAVIVGNELRSLSTDPSCRTYWHDLIGQVRAVYRGKIGYNAGGLMGDHPDALEFKRVTFLEDLDFIGITTYPQLSTKVDATREDYARGWSSAVTGENLIAALNAFIAKSPANVCITELGAPAIRGGQFFLPEPGPTTYDLDLQARFYEVSLDILLRRTNGKLLGVLVYAWYPTMENSIVSKPTPADPNGAYSWNVRGKPAQDAIRRAFIGSP